MKFTHSKNKYVEWILRIGVFGTFFGHGIFALQVKESWIPLMTSFGLTEAMSRTLLPLIGWMDIAVAILALAWPIKAILLWASIWAFATALSRPVAGMPFWDMVERTSNWAAPLALLILYGLPQKLKELFKI